MSNTFKEVQGMDHIINVAGQLIDFNESVCGASLSEIDNFIESFEKVFKKAVGVGDFKNRFNREQRRQEGLSDISKRRYNRMYRISLRMEKKRAKLEYEIEKRKYAQVSKSRLAHRVTQEEFSKDPLTSAFIAYYAAKCNKRSLYTNSSQERPFDIVCEEFIKELNENPTTNWWAVALVYPDVSVLEKLTENQKGQLLGIWYEILNKLACILKKIWIVSNIDRTTMIVQRGNDSTNWNVMAGAWNKARDAWINLLYSMNMEKLLNIQCPGKVLRLMASDVAYWHRSSGGSLEPDTAVWNDVPLPWEVFLGNVHCTKDSIEETCNKYGVDAYKKGWVGPKPLGEVHAFNPTPELVHGIIVSSPELAKILRKAKVFSGKTIKNLNLDPEIIDKTREDHYNLIENKA